MTAATWSGDDGGGRAAGADRFDVDRLVRDYGDIAGEVAACRNGAALFDFSFVSIARVSGVQALHVIRQLTDRRLDDLSPGRVRYALRTDPEGHLLADWTVWNEGDGSYLVMSGRRADIADLTILTERSPGQINVEDFGDSLGLFAVQGPESLRILADLVDPKRLAALPYFGFAGFEVAGVSCLIGRLGYTGERGFEIVLPAENRDDLWQLLSARARPAGFAAADCLRIEAGFVLFANEFRLLVTAAEAGLGAFSSRPATPLRHRLVCFRAETDEPPVLWLPPQHLKFPEPGNITVTSACLSALAASTLGLGFVAASAGGLDRPFTDPSGRFQNLRTVPRPYFAAARRRPRGPWIRTAVS